MTRFIFTTMALALTCAGTAYAEPKTWTGQISDSMCGAKHMSMGKKKMTDAECTQACVKANAQYVLVSDGKVYQIADQKATAWATHAGHRVVITGELAGETISATKVEMAPKK